MSAVFSDDFKAWIQATALKAWELIKAAAVWVWERYARELICFGIGLLAGLLIMSAHTDKAVNKVSAQYEAQIAEMQAVEEKEATAGQLWSQKNQLTENLARVLQGVDRYDLSKTAKLAYLEVIRNRSNPDIQYDVMRGTDTLEDVLQVPGQFEGFRYGEGYYTKTNFEIAQEFLDSNSSYLNSDRYFWAKISNGSVVAMDSFDGSGSNQKVS